MRKLYLLVALAATALAVSACNQRSTPSDDSMLSKFQLKEIKALNDPGNPYSSQYSEWDQHAFEVLSKVQQKGSLASLTDHGSGLADRVSGTKNFDYYVDANGYLVPKLLCVKIREDFYSNGSRAGVMDPFSSFSHVLAPIPMSDDDYKRFQIESDAIIAKYFPQVPRWLSDAPPAGGAILYPKGEVLCFGPLGSWSGPHERGASHMEDSSGSASHDSTGGTEDEHSDLYLYDQSGKLLSEAKDTAPINLFAGHMGAYGIGGEPLVDQVNFESTRDGYFILRDKASNKVVRVVDYDGKPLASTEVPPVRNLHNFFTINPNMLRRIYAAQQN